MAKVTLEDGRVVDALALLGSNIRDYLQVARRLQEESKDGTSEHQSAVGELKNCLYFLSLTVEELPKRTYHTPGPWTHAFNANGSMRGVWGRSDMTSMVCYMTNPVPGNLEGSANAHLIGAAPDLLEALEAIVEDIRDDEIYGAEGRYIGYAKHALLSSAYAAIAKARGEQ